SLRVGGGRGADALGAAETGSWPSMIGGLLPLPIVKDLDVNQPTSCCRAQGTAGAYCHNCDLLLGLAGLHVTGVHREPGLLTVTVEAAPGPVGCPTCGTVAEAHSRRAVRLVDAGAQGHRRRHAGVL